MARRDTLNYMANLQARGKLSGKGKKFLCRFKENKSAEPFDPTFRAAPGGAEHWANFLDAIRSGKDETLTCDIIEGHYSTALPHLANISYRLGREFEIYG